MLHRLLYITVFTLAIGCGGNSTTPPPPNDNGPDTVQQDGTLGNDFSNDYSVLPGLSPQMTLGTWNLHNFSKYGVDEWRLPDITAKIQELDLDVLAVQELKIDENNSDESAQAWSGLLSNLDDYEGIAAPWEDKDTCVGLLYRKSTVSLASSTVLFPYDWSAFPRPPIEANLRVQRDGKQIDITVIVLHLKAFKDSVDRRREACQKLDAHMAQSPEKHFVVIGDFNDDPYDPPAQNSYTDTFLDTEPKYYFVTATLPPETVTSTGYYHYVNGQKITGEFLDHAVITGSLNEEYNAITPSVVALPSSQFSSWKKDYSDHFPVILTFQ